MIKLNSITVDGLGRLTGSLDLSSPTILYGPNDRGKSTWLKAIQLALLGYVPGEGKRAMDVLARSRNGRVYVQIETTGQTITRTFTRRGDKCASESEPDADAIQREFAPAAWCFDLTEIGSTPEKRREFLMSLCDLQADRALTRDTVISINPAAAEIFDHAWGEDCEPGDGLLAVLEAFRQKSNEASSRAREAQRALEGTLADLTEASRNCPAMHAGALTTRMNALEHEIEELTAAHARAQERYEQSERVAVRKAALEAEKRRLTEPLTASIPDVQDLRKALQECVDAESSLTSSRDTALAEQALLRSELGMVDEFLTLSRAHPDACPTCGATDTYRGKHDDYTARRASLMERLRSCKQQCDDLQKAVMDRRVAADDIRNEVAQAERMQEREKSRQESLRRVEEELANLPDVEAMDVPDIESEISPLIAERQEIRLDLKRLTARDTLQAAVDKFSRNREDAQHHADWMKAVYVALQDVRASLMQRATEDLVHDVNSILRRMDPELVFCLRFEDDRGKSVLDWSVRNGSGNVPVHLWGDGTQALVSTAILTTIMSRTTSPCPVLLLDRIETISSERRQQLVDALDSIRDRFSAIVLAGVHPVEKVPPDWNLVEL